MLEILPRLIFKVIAFCATFSSVQVKTGKGGASAEKFWYALCSIETAPQDVEVACWIKCYFTSVCSICIRSKIFLVWTRFGALLGEFLSLATYEIICLSIRYVHNETSVAILAQAPFKRGTCVTVVCMLLTKASRGQSGKPNIIQIHTVAFRTAGVLIGSIKAPSSTKTFVSLATL